MEFASTLYLTLFIVFRIAIALAVVDASIGTDGPSAVKADGSLPVELAHGCRASVVVRNSMYSKAAEGGVGDHGELHIVFWYDCRILLI